MTNLVGEKSLMDTRMRLDEAHVTYSSMFPQLEVKEVALLRLFLHFDLHHSQFLLHLLQLCVLIFKL